MRLLVPNLISLLFLISCTEEPEETKPSISTITESVYASVTIQPEDMYSAYSAIPGIIEKLNIREGDSVRKGQLLAQITATAPKLNIDNALLSVELSRESYQGKANILSSIRDEIRISEEQAKLDSLNYQRQKKLWAQNIGSKMELENRALKYDLSKSKIISLRKKLKQTQLELENSYKRSQNALKKAKTNLDDYTIKSKIDGTVYNLLKNEGELIGLQEPLAKIGKDDSFIIEMLIDEVDIAKITLGLPILITLDAYGKQVFEAEIVKIYPQKNTRTQTFKVEGLFKKPPEVLYSGLSGEANIILSIKENTVTIPLDYLVEGKRVKTPSGEEEVRTGIRNMESVEILSGIDTSTIILKP